LDDWQKLLALLSKVSGIVVTEDKDDRVILAEHKYGQGDVAYTFDEHNNLVDTSVESS
jgi:hypothetical protein